MAYASDMVVSCKALPSGQEPDTHVSQLEKQQACLFISDRHRQLWDTTDL